MQFSRDDGLASKTRKPDPLTKLIDPLQTEKTDLRTKQEG